MDFVSVSEFASQHGISERTVRNYCALGKIEGTFLTGKAWNIPADAELPMRKSKRSKQNVLLSVLRDEKTANRKGGIYHRSQIDFAFNSNHIEGSRLSHEQTRYIFETNTLGVSDEAVSVDDVIETVNHFRCFDLIVDHAEEKLTEKFIKELHGILKSGTNDSRKTWFCVGDYKKLPNEVGGHATCQPEEVHALMKAFLLEYNAKKIKCFDDILDFHKRFEDIHPFQDGNGRVGRLIMFKECLANGIVPFIITDALKFYYYRGLNEWPQVVGFLRDTCLTAQDEYKMVLDYFKIKY